MGKTARGCVNAVFIEPELFEKGRPQRPAILP